MTPRGQPALRAMPVNARYDEGTGGRLADSGDDGGWPAVQGVLPGGVRRSP